MNKQDITKINLKSKSQVDDMYTHLKKCRPVIAFWLTRMVFPIDLRQYTDSITSSSWDIASAPESIGFSGTKDSRWVFPAYLSWVPSNDYEIKGTDGKNIALLLTQTRSVLEINGANSNEGNFSFIWEKFIVKALQEKVTCIIDAGAILVGKSIQDQICKWLGDLLIKSNSRLKGITFPNKSGKWGVYDFWSRTYIQRGTRIPQHETFVIFDEARTRGADIKMSSDVCAALTLAPNMTKDKLMQAMGRLRKIQSGQTIKIFATREVLQKIQGYKENLDVQLLTKHLIKWVIKNSADENKKFIYRNNQLSWLHFRSLNLVNRPYLQKFNPDLSNMYKNSLTQETPFNLNKQIIENLKENERNILQNPIFKIQQQKLQRYGKNFKIKCQGFQDVCQRQVQITQQVQQQQQKQTSQLVPLKQNQFFQQTEMTNITTLPYIFSPNLKVSYNFRNCTNSNWHRSDNNINEVNKYNQLMYINYVKVSRNNMCLITQREANKFLREGYQYANPDMQVLPVNMMTQYTYKQTLKTQNQLILKFADLTSNSPILAQLNLTNLFIYAQFFNGHQTFSKQKTIRNPNSSNHNSDSHSSNTVISVGSQMKSQYQILKEKLVQNRVAKLTDWEARLQELPTHFLERRRLFVDKYQESSLQKIYIALCNDKLQ